MCDLEVIGAPSILRNVTGLWARPVIRYRPVTGPYRITTSPGRAGTGERVHRYRFTGWSVQQMTSMEKPQNEECWTFS